MTDDDFAQRIISFKNKLDMWRESFALILAGSWNYNWLNFCKTTVECNWAIALNYVY